MVRGITMFCLPEDVPNTNLAAELKRRLTRLEHVEQLLESYSTGKRDALALADQLMNEFFITPPNIEAYLVRAELSGIGHMLFTDDGAINGWTPKPMKGIR
jgi:hypothetical protein